MEDIALRLFALALVVGILPHSLAGQTAFIRANAMTVRLRPDSFPGLPRAIARDLERRGCRIPQVSTIFPVKGPHNAVHGAIYGPGGDDWAVLCSVRDTSHILVYRAAIGAVVDSLATLPDETFLQVLTGSGEIGFSRRLGLVDGPAIRASAAAYEGPAPPTVIDHLGIDDAYLGKASSVFYFFAGKWLRLQGAD